MQTSLSQALDSLRPLAEALFVEIASMSADGPGITRAAFGDKETMAGEIIARFARAEGLAAAFDGVGNLAITDPAQPRNAPEIMIGSHLDSVPLGGNFDGLAGVIGGALVLAAFRRAGIVPPHPVRVVGFRCEESPWFGTAYLGSKLYLGLLTPQDLDTLRRFDTGRTLAEHLSDIGVRPTEESLRVPQVAPADLRAYIELHIEQASLLESCDVPIGIARAIRGNIRFPFAKCLGRYAHSGAVPRHLRADAALATAKLLAHADAVWSDLIDQGHDDLVFTCGILQTDPSQHAMTKVVGEMKFTLNIGATSDEAMAALHDAIRIKADQLALEHDVRFEFGDRVGTPAVQLDRPIQEAAAHAAGFLDIKALAMPTVGHDAAMFSRRGVPAGVVLMRNANGSHNPDESLDIADFMLGVKVVAQTALGL